MAEVPIDNDDTTRTHGDPTSLLPEEPMVYEIKKKKKKKKHKEEDPFKDVKEAFLEKGDSDIEESKPGILDIVKVENIEIDIDCNDYLLQDSQDADIKPEYYGDTHTNTSFRIEVGSTYTCDICNLVFGRANTLKIHKMKKHGSNGNFDFDCPHCDMCYEKKGSLVVHIKRKHKNKPPPDDKEVRSCEICSLAFVGMPRLRMHMQRKHGSFSETFKHECAYCGLCYEKYNSLLAHTQRKHVPQKPTQNQIYKCQFCPKCFTLKESYMIHVKRHHQIKDLDEMLEEPNHVMTTTGHLACEQCPLVFSNQRTLKMHMRRNHNAFKDSFMLKCSICNLSYDRMESLKRHIKRKHDQGSYCSVCKKQFETHEEYLNHDHKTEVHECPTCGMIFSSQFKVFNHMRLVHKIDVGNKRVHCPNCTEEFHSKRQLHGHMSKVHLKMRYPCTECDKVFSLKESLRQHVLRKHTKHNHYKLELTCEYCNTKFSNEKDMCSHIQSVHTEIDIKDDEDDVHPYKCTKCTESYPTWAKLKTHNDSVHCKLMKSEDVLCQICSESVPAAKLQHHLKSKHSDNLKCQYCDYEAPKKVDLTTHLLRHKDLTPMKCDWVNCTYSTFNKLALEKHKMKHAQGDTMLHCSKCPFQTMNKYIMKYHEEEHFKGKKRYDCDQCEYATFTQSNLIQHRNKHLTEKKFKCEVCSFATKYNTSLRFHIKKKHCDLPVVDD